MRPRDLLLFFFSPRFEEEEYFTVLVKKTAQELSNGIPDCGHLYASIRASKNLTPSGELQEMFSGMDQVKSYWWRPSARPRSLALQLQCSFLSVSVGLIHSLSAFPSLAGEADEENSRNV